MPDVTDISAIKKTPAYKAFTEYLQARVNIPFEFRCPHYAATRRSHIWIESCVPVSENRRSSRRSLALRDMAGRRIFFKGILFR